MVSDLPHITQMEKDKPMGKHHVTVQAHVHILRGDVFPLSREVFPEKSSRKVGVPPCKQTKENIHFTFLLIKDYVLQRRLFSLKIFIPLNISVCINKCSMHGQINHYLLSFVWQKCPLDSRLCLYNCYFYTHTHTTTDISKN